jgi:hypothetical protein
MVFEKWKRLRLDGDPKRERERSRRVTETLHIFFVVANYRRRKKSTNRLEDDGNLIEDTPGMLKHAMQFYKTLFGKEVRENIKLGAEFWSEEENITPEENRVLEAALTEEEIKEAIFGSYAEGPPRPDGFSFLLYHKFWGTIKKDFMALIRGFEKVVININIARINYAVITLIPKEDEASTMKKFRPIILINCSFKIFSKALNNRLIATCDRLLANNQTIFEGRFILESVVAAHEIIHDAARRGK